MLSRNLVLSLIAALFLCAPRANAASIKEIKDAAIAARDTFVAALKNKDKRDAKHQGTIKETADKVSKLIAETEKGIPADKKDKFNELKTTWADFKKTRENELMSAVLANKQEEAEKISTDIQKPRMKKITEICDELIAAGL